MDNDLPAQVDVLKALIEKEEENYKLAIKQNAEYETLKKITNTESEKCLASFRQVRQTG